MNPSVTSPLPAKDNMGMDYVPVYADEEEESETTNVPGRASFALSQDRQQLIGLTTAKADIRPLSLEIRANGQIAFDPDLFNAIEEYRQALEAASQMEGVSAIKSQSLALIQAARTKLSLLGLSGSQIRTLGSSHTDPMSLLLPKGSAWAYAEVYEYEAPNVKTGQEVKVTTPALPGETLTGKITSVSPVLNAQTRTIRVRALIPDPKGRLRPDTFVNVSIKVDLGQVLSVPSDSVLHSGTADYVFLVKGKGVIEPRQVIVGYKTKDFVEIRSGLSSDEEVATAANFLLDSEARLRATLHNATRGSSADKRPEAP